MLDDSGPDHGGAAGEETGGDPLDGGEADSLLAQGGVDEEIADGDEDDQREGIQVGENVVGNAVQRHGGGLRGQVVVDLVVGDPVEWVPEEHAAGVPATADFVNPGVVESHP